VYSIGACLYACMSGLPPQESDKRLKEDGMPAAVKSFRGLYSNEMLSMVERCLSLNSLERPQTVFALQKELLAIVPLRGESDHAVKPASGVRSVSDSVKRFMKQHKITWF
jgi:serine/threonine protein kinase